MPRVLVVASGIIVLLACLVRVLYPDMRELMFIPFALLKYSYAYKIGRTRQVEWAKLPLVHNREAKPNIIIILVDDLGFNDVSYFGGGFRNISTPNIDSIGEEGASYSSAYAGCATCAPSRASLMTGRYPTKVGLEFTPTGSTWGPYMFGKLINVGNLQGIYHADKAATFNKSSTDLPLSEVTIAESLKPAGYRSLHLGKWHLGNSLSPSSPFNRGFDEALTSSSGTYHIAENSPHAVNCKIDDAMDKFVWAAMSYWTRFNNGSAFQPDGYVTDYLAREAAAAINANSEHPFFMYLSFTAMHTPLQALRSDYDKLVHIEDHCARVYAAMLVALDRAVGTVLQALEDNGLTDNTMVIFTSDNGAPGYIGLRDLNYPLRGFKGTFFEGGIRVPLFVKYPRGIAPGVIVDDIVSHVDVFPTIMTLAGVPVKHSVDGIDILPLAAAASEEKRHRADGRDVSETQHSTSGGHETLFWRSHHYMCLRKGYMKIKRSDRPPKVWLFDLQADPLERYNLVNSSAHENVLRDMISSLDEENGKQSIPQWPCLSESPILVDKLNTDPYVEGDEYVYWPN